MGYDLLGITSGPLEDLLCSPDGGPCQVSKGERPGG